jgi:hypothetical protein
VVIDRDDARRPRLHHADVHSLAKAHFFQPGDQVALAVDVENLAFFAGF